MTEDLKRKAILKKLAGFFIAIALIYFLYWLAVGRFYEVTDDAYVNGNIIQVMPQISAQVTSILADETDLVTKGQPIITLDKSDAEITLKNAESQLALTTRQVSQLYQKVDQLRADVALQQSQFEKAQADFQRRKGLDVKKVISVEDLQHAKVANSSATAALASAKAQLAATIALVSNSDLYHHPQVIQAASNLRQAYLNWRRTTIYAPETGYVAKRSAQVGQQVNLNTALMLIVPLNQVWVDANFKESELKHIRIGQPVEIVVDAYGSDVEYNGTVIGLNPGTGSAFDLLPPQNATGNWIKIVQRLPVRIALNPKQLAEHPLRIGLSVTVTVNTHKRKGLVLTQQARNKTLYETKNYSAELKEADHLVDQILQANAPNATYHAAN